MGVLGIPVCGLQALGPRGVPWVWWCPSWLVTSSRWVANKATHLHQMTEQRTALPAVCNGAQRNGCNTRCAEHTQGGP